MFASSIRSLLARHWPAADAVPRSQRAEAITLVWQRLCEQGLGALGADPQLGGWSTILDLAQELGRAACPAPLIEAALLRQAAAATPIDLTALLTALEAGECRPAFALGALDGDPDAGAADLARPAAAQSALEGEVRFVDGTLAATHFVVAIAAPPGLAILERGAAGVRLELTPGLAVPSLATLTFAKSPAVFLPLESPRLADIARLARLGAAARALGAARQAFELVVEHVKVRRQFGQAVGKFQAIQHKLADCFLGLEASGLLLGSAASHFDRGQDDWRRLATSAWAFASETLRQVSLETHHAFGAIGYSEEHEAPRHFRRIFGDLARLGGVHRARAELADDLFAPGSTGLPDLDLGPSANAFRAEIREWLAVHWNDEARRREAARAFHERTVDRDFSRSLGERGWIAVSWPREHGGQGRTPIEQFVFVEEMSYAGAPTGAHGCAAEMVGPALIAFGSSEQKREFLPAFLRGERMFCLGYSESEAGSDLAGLRMSAVRDGEDWIVNGEKLWTSRAEFADYHWLAVRTDPQAKPRHAGISVLMAPLSSPGITIRPSMALYGHTFSTVTYENVRIPDRLRVGEVNGGWKVITHALASERVLMGSYISMLRSLFDAIVVEVAARRRCGRPLAQDPLVRDRLGDLAAQIEAARHLSVHGVRVGELGRVPVAEGAMTKVYSGELMQRVTQAAIELLGTSATLSEQSAGAIAEGRIEQLLRRSIMMVVGGGTAEIQRNLIALRALGLPR